MAKWICRECRQGPCIIYDAAKTTIDCEYKKVWKPYMPPIKNDIEEGMVVKGGVNNGAPVNPRPGNPHGQGSGIRIQDAKQCQVYHPTRLELFAMAAMQGFIIAINNNQESGDIADNDIAQFSITQAKALIEALDKEASDG